MTRQALITGANGFIGSHLARKLRSQGWGVRCLVRASADQTLLDGVDGERCEGDVTDAGSIHKAVEGTDVVFHMAGIRRSPTPADFERVNVDGTRNVFEAASQSAHPPRVVLASSLAAMGPSAEGSPLTEDAPQKPSEWYGESKAKAEKVCHEFAGRVPFSILRPPRVIGPGDRENLFFFRIVRRGYRIVIGGGPRHLSMIDVDDLVDAFVLLGEHPAAAGEAFFAAADEAITLEGILDMVAQSLGVKTRTVYVPRVVLLGLAFGADMVSKATGRHLPLNMKLARQLLAPGWTCSTDKARRTLGFTPRISLKDSIVRAARWYVDHGLL